MDHQSLLLEIKPNDQIIDIESLLPLDWKKEKNQQNEALFLAHWLW